MKKIVAIMTFMCCMLISVFAQETEGKIPSAEVPFDNAYFEENKTKTETYTYTTEQVKEICNKNTNNPQANEGFDETCSIKIEYQPVFDVVRIYYECMYITYDQGEAMNTILACLEDFQKDHKYFRYRYIKEDRERFFKDDRGKRKAQYISTVKFSR